MEAIVIAIVIVVTAAEMGVDFQRIVVRTDTAAGYAAIDADADATATHRHEGRGEDVEPANATSGMASDTAPDAVKAVSLKPIEVVVPGTSVTLAMRPIAPDVGDSFYVATTEATWDLYDAFIFNLDTDAGESTEQYNDEKKAYLIEKDTEKWTSEVVPKLQNFCEHFHSMLSESV